MNKIKTLSVLGSIVKKLKKQGKVIVFTNGCFDILHPGHIKVLKEAKKKGDVLIVGLNSDSSVKRIKGKSRPILDEKARAEVLAALNVVDYIVIFDKDNPYQLIKTLRPDFLVKGGDWEREDIVGRELVGRVIRVRLLPGYSTSAFIKKIKNIK
jgi:D-beta-D-heptose 7-phosphate kinase/D-beta-D-heptose 1-phosphate adenosyltransferase